jgi:hypothetical protein
VKKTDHLILGVHVTDRVQRAEEVQAAFTKHGGTIKTRLGLHEVDGKRGAPSGVILLEVAGPAKNAVNLAKDLRRIRGIEVRQITFRHA